MKGWTKINRKIVEWEWYKVSHMVHLFYHLIISANHKDAKWQSQDVKRGQLITGLNSLSYETGIPIQKIRTGLKRLESTGEIKVKSTNKFSIITICKYETYQITDEPTNKQLTIKQQSNNNKQECKELKKRYREFVLMTETEVQKLIKDYGEDQVERMLDKLDNYKGSSGKKYKSDYRAIQTWVVKDFNKRDGTIKVIR